MRRRLAVVAVALLVAPLVAAVGEASAAEHGGTRPAQEADVRPNVPRTSDFVVSQVASDVLSAANRARARADRRRVVRIMPLGDSITLGGGSPTVDGYRKDLFLRLRATGLRVNFVGSQHDGTGPDDDHEGHSHWTIQDIAAHVDHWLDVYRPDVVLLNVGTNNTQRPDDAMLAPALLAGLIDRIVADRPDVQLFVTRITSAKNAERQPLIDAYNAQVPGIVATRGAHVHLVDQSSVGGRDLRDNIHPNDFGYAKMAWNWYQALEPVLGPRAVSWPAGADPYTATKAYLCAADNPYRYLSGSDCRWWFLRTTADGQDWQTLRQVRTPYQAVVDGYFRESGVARTAARSWVPQHLATRYRMVSVWSSE